MGSFAAVFGAFLAAIVGAITGALQKISLGSRNIRILAAVVATAHALAGGRWPMADGAPNVWVCTPSRS